MSFTTKQLDYLRSKLVKLPEYILPEEVEKILLMMKDETLNRFYANALIGSVMHLMKPLSYDARCSAIKDLQKIICEYHYD